MSKKRRTTPKTDGRVDEKNLNPNPDNSADQQEVKGGLKEKAKAAGSKVAGTAKSIGGKIWDNRGKIGLMAGVAVTALVGMAGVKRKSDDDSEDYYDECPEEIEQPEPDEEMPDTEAADE
ncbi:MAG: hypothetical protein IKO79_03105 [Butyrivibrio sp.]|nr:hypothetical protein [Butyrivibrio sp.]